LAEFLSFSLVATLLSYTGNRLAVKTGSGAQELEPVSVSGLAEFELFPVAAEIFRDKTGNCLAVNTGSGAQEGRLT